MRLRRRPAVAKPGLAGGGGDQLEPEEKRPTREAGAGQSHALASSSRTQMYRDEVRRLRDQAVVPGEGALRRDLQELAHWYEALAEAAEKQDQRHKAASNRSRSEEAPRRMGRLPWRRFNRSD